MYTPPKFNSFVIKGFYAYLFLTQGKKTVIGIGYLEKVLNHRWHARRNGNVWYAARRFSKGSSQTLHNYMTGFTQTDHIDYDGLNNLRSNMREGGNGINQRNQTDSGRNTSGYRGVHKRKDDGRFEAGIRVSGRTVHLGRYGTAEEAARAYDKALKRYCPGRFPLNFQNDKEPPLR
jgi:hypothetical protein